MTPQWDFNVAGEVLLVDKPLGWTSFDVIRKMRAMFQIRKIGHAGTLDPRATGLLIVCTGPKTKLIDGYIGYDKEYTGSFEIGFTTSSYDLETPVLERTSAGHVTALDIESTARGFMGQRDQQPPMYSAAKVKGRALYKYAREGKTVVRQTRKIEISQFDVDASSLPEVRFRLVCSKGTYVRSVVHEIGEQLGVGATLTGLRRVRVGPWKIEDAWTIDTLTAVREQSRPSPTAMHDHQPAS